MGYYKTEPIALHSLYTVVNKTCTDQIKLEMEAASALRYIV